MVDRVARRAEYMSPTERARRLQRLEDLAAQIRQEAADLRAAEAAVDGTVDHPPLRH